VLSNKAGIAATDAEVTKCWKNNDLLDNTCLQSVAIKTTCVYDKSPVSFELPYKETCWYIRWPHSRSDSM